jgi:thiamine-monophosphate kinase
MNEQSLEDFGEFRVLNEVVFPAIRDSAARADLGNDCAFIEIPSTDQALVITTDAGPRPLIWSLGFECYRTWGWYTVICNASDLAAAAAQPLAFFSSVEATNTMAISQLQEFFVGLAEACAECGLIVAGGNLRSAQRFGAHGTALGIVRGKPFIGRQGAQPGSYLVVIGECGRFISTFLKAQRHGIQAMDVSEIQVLTRPRPLLSAMGEFASRHLIETASDNSDGVLGAVWNICERSLCGAELEMDDASLPSFVSLTAAANRLNPWNLLFFWGDYSIIATIPESRMDEFVRTATEGNVGHRVLGRIVPGPTALYGLADGKKRGLRLLRNENFARHGFNNDVRDHLQYMLREDLFID